MPWGEHPIAKVSDVMHTALHNGMTIQAEFRAMKPTNIQSARIGSVPSPREQRAGSPMQPLQASGADTSNQTPLHDTKNHVPGFDTPRTERIEWLPENHPML